MSKLLKPITKSLKVLNRLNQPRDSEGSYENVIDQDTIKNLASNFEDAQKRTFTKWINVQLNNTDFKVESIDTDLRDGKLLLKLLSILSGEKVAEPEKKLTRIHMIANVNKCIEFLEFKIHEPLHNIGSADIVDGNAKLTLALIWVLILRLRIQKRITNEDSIINMSPNVNNLTPALSHLSNNEADRSTLSAKQSTELTTPKFSVHGTPSRSNNVDAKQFLLGWVQQQLSMYEGLVPQVTDFRSSWKNGVAFSALINRHDSSLLPDLGTIVERASRDSSEWTNILSNAFTIAANGMGIPQLLDPHDVAGVSNPDEKIIMIYVSEFYDVMSKKQRLEEVEAWKRKQIVFEQFTHLANSINAQLDSFAEITIDLPSYDAPRDVQKLEELSELQKSKSSTIFEYEPTIETLIKTGNSLVNSYADSEPTFIEIVKGTQGEVLKKWDALLEEIEQQAEMIQNLNVWGELNDLLTTFGHKLDDFHSDVTDLMDKRGTLPPEEAETQFGQLSDVLKEHLQEWNELHQRGQSKAPPHITEKLKRYKEFLDLSKGNLDRYKALEQFQKFKDNLSDKLLTLFNKRSEVRKLVMKTMWTPEVTDYTEIEQNITNIDSWVKNDGETLITMVKEKCIDIRKLIEDSNLSNQNSQLSTILLKEEEVMVSWQELSRLANLAHQLLSQSKKITQINSKLDEIEQALKQAEGMISEGADQSKVQAILTQAQDDLNGMENEKDSIPVVNSPEAQAATKGIINYVNQRFNHLCSQLESCKLQKQQIEENSELLKLFEESLGNGTDLIDTLNKQTQWVDRALELLATMEASQVQEITTQLSSKLEELGTEITMIEGKHKKFVGSVDEVYPKLQLKSHKEELDVLKKEAVVLFKNLETGASNIIQGVLSGDFICSKVNQVVELLNAVKELQSAITSSNLDKLNAKAFDEWRMAIKDVDVKCSSLLDAPPNDFNPALIPKLNAQLDRKTQELRETTEKSSTLLEEHYETFKNKDFRMHIANCESFQQECEDLISKSKTSINENGKILGVMLEDNLIKHQEFKVAYQEHLLTRSHIKPKYKSLQSDFDNISQLPSTELTSTASELHQRSMDLFSNLETTLESCKILIDFNPGIIESFKVISDITEDLNEDQQNIIDLINIPSAELDNQINHIEKCLQDRKNALQSIKIPADINQKSESLDPNVAEITRHNVTELEDQLIKANRTFESINKMFLTNQKTAREAQSIEIDQKFTVCETWCQQQFETLVKEREQIKSCALKPVSSVASINTLFTKIESNHDRLKDKIKVQLNEIDELETKMKITNTDKSPRLKALLAELEQDIHDHQSTFSHIKVLTTHVEICKEFETEINSFKLPLVQDILNANSFKALDLALSDSGELVNIKNLFETSLQSVQPIFDSLDSDNSELFSFVEKEEITTLAKLSTDLRSEFDKLHTLKVLSQSNLEVSAKAQHLLELIDELQNNVDKIDHVDVSQSKKSEALDLIKNRLHDPIMKEYEVLRRMVLNLPDGSKDWSIKVKSISEMTHLLLSAIEEKQSEIANAVMVKNFMSQSDEMDNLIGQFLEVIDSVTAIADSSTSFLEELERANMKLKTKGDSITAQATDLIDTLSSQCQKINDWRAEQRLTLITEQWDEASDLAKSVMEKLYKRIEYKQESHKLNNAKSLQRAHSRNHPRYIPPDKNKIGSRYMQKIGNVRPSKQSAKPQSNKSDEKVKSPNRYVPNLKDNLDIEIARVVNDCPEPIKVARDPETGKYWIGDKDPKLCFCRVLNSRMVMVRVGGGWKELSKFLLDYSEKHSSNPGTIKSPSQFFRAYNPDLTTIDPHSKHNAKSTISPESTLRKFTSPLLGNRTINIALNSDQKAPYGAGFLPLEYKNRPKSRLGSKTPVSTPTSRSQSEGANNAESQLNRSNRSSVLLSPTGSNNSRPSSRMYSRPNSSMSGNYASPTISSSSRAIKVTQDHDPSSRQSGYGSLDRGLKLQKARSSSSLGSESGKSSTKSVPPKKVGQFNLFDQDAFSPISEANELSVIENSPESK